MKSLTLPVISIEPFFGGTPRQKQQIADEIGHWCAEVGIFSIVDHGVSPELLAQSYRLAHDFFDLPLAEKRKLQAPSGYGYISLLDEYLATKISLDSCGDLKESVNYRPDTPPDLWPAGLPAFKPVLLEAFAALEGLAVRLVQILAYGLGLPEDYFQPYLTPSDSILRFVNYPPPLAKPRPNQYRCETHADYGTLSILQVEEKPGGLEAQDRHGEWFEVKAGPAALVVNLGEVMEAWSEGRWMACLHRVGNPEPERWQESRRQSLIFFHNPPLLYDKVQRYLARCSTYRLVNEDPRLAAKS